MIDLPHRQDYLDTDPVAIFRLPRTMDNLDLHQVSRVLVELGPARRSLQRPSRATLGSVHDIVDINQIIEKPAFFDERITQDISQTDCVDVA